MTNQQVTKPTAKNDFLSLLSSPSTDSQLAKVLPPNLTVERFKRIVRTAFLRNPSLQELEPASIMLSVMTLATLGLEPDGRMAHLVPFKGKCAPMPGYMGYIARAKENGVTGIHFDNVFLNDDFKFRQTANGLEFHHEQDWRNPDRGEMFAAYCVWKEKGSDALHGAIMPRLEIERIRDGSPAKSQAPWTQHFLEMSKKTIIRRAQKQWPLDVQLDEAIKSGKVLDASTVDIESEIVLNAPPVQYESPAASLPQAEEEKPTESQPETAKQFLARMMYENGVTYDELIAFCNATGVCTNADTFASIDDMPIAVVDVLVTPAKMSKILKTYRKEKKA